MAEIRLTKAKIRNVPIAVTPEGFWCCPSPVGFPKNQKPQNPLNRPKSSPLQTQDNPIPKKQNSIIERKPGTPSSSRMGPVNDEQRMQTSDSQVLNNPPAVNEKVSRPKVESVSRKVAIEFGEARTSDLKVIVLGKQGIAVKLSVHRSVLVENSVFFSKKILGHQLVFPCLEIEDCEDVEIYVETIGLMYCNELKQRLMRQSVSRVLRIIKVAEQLGFAKCVHSCLEYLEAAPWVGEEEQEQVVSSILHLETEGILVKPVLKRVCSDIPKPPNDTLTHILELVLKSNEERARREMKSVVLKLLKENNSLPSSSGSSDLGNETIYCSCRRSLDSLLSLFRRATEPDLIDEQMVIKSMALEADNLLWLLDILADRQAADVFAIIWSNQQELASLHAKLPLVSRHHVSKITARLFVGIGKGELLPSKDTRHLLLQTWLQPLMNDYSWLQHACRSFDRKVVEEGIGRTILTLPLEDQQSILLSWLGSFLKAGDSCPNLQRAFEVWWRRTFVRPYVEPEILQQVDSVIMPNVE